MLSVECSKFIVCDEFSDVYCGEGYCIAEIFILFFDG